MFRCSPNPNFRTVGRLAKDSALRKEMRLLALGSSCTASSRLAAASWLGFNAKDEKSVGMTTSGGPGVTGVLSVRNSRVTDWRA